MPIDAYLRGRPIEDGVEKAIVELKRRMETGTQRYMLLTIRDAAGAGRVELDEVGVSSVRIAHHEATVGPGDRSDDILGSGENDGDAENPKATLHRVVASFDRTIGL